MDYLDHCKLLVFGREQREKKSSTHDKVAVVSVQRIDNTIYVLHKVRSFKNDQYYQLSKYGSKVTMINATGLMRARVHMSVSVCVRAMMLFISAEQIMIVITSR